MSSHCFQLVYSSQIPDITVWSPHHFTSLDFPILFLYRALTVPFCMVATAAFKPTYRTNVLRTNFNDTSRGGNDFACRGSMRFSCRFHALCTIATPLSLDTTAICTTAGAGASSVRTGWHITCFFGSHFHDASTRPLRFRERLLWACAFHLND